MQWETTEQAASTMAEFLPELRYRVAEIIAAQADDRDG